MGFTAGKKKILKEGDQKGQQTSQKASQKQTQQKEQNQPPQKRLKTLKRSRSEQQKEPQSTSADAQSRDDEIAELKQRIKELEMQTKKTRKLSALNRFKKFVLGKITEKAFAETQYIDLISIDKMRLLNKAYPLIWEELVLNPLYEEHNLTSQEEKEQFKNQKNVQKEYNKQVDNLLEQMKEGELDDQEHFLEDLTELMKQALDIAAESFGGDDDDEEEEEVNETAIENEE